MAVILSGQHCCGIQENIGGGASGVVESIERSTG
jgi:hypothetical protein